MKLRTPSSLCTLCIRCIRCISVYNPINVIKVARTNDTFFAVTINVSRMMQQLAPFAGLVVTVDSAWETSDIYLTIIWNIISMVHFINTNKCNVYVDRNKASNILFTNSIFN